ncbi:helix-turn-helix domain-containing protein [Crenalkalicoccus roseus]|uniref:helix-turn-helix domain-containing protein n=1 Tax=Crenalkalicoccus roseus TaxID=1485588 RepID=UPI0013051BB7|nr:helix-turn-helix transcriptional regulator [Crenalkalicoccus roseus]
MTLQEYLQRHRLTQAEFGRIVGVRHATVSRWLAGKITPSFARLRRIEAVTGGAVTAASFCGHLSCMADTGAPERAPHAQNGVNAGLPSPPEAA